MTVTENVGGLGAWEIELADSLPDVDRERLGFFGHLVIVDGPLEVAAYGDALLDVARYVGVMRQRDKETGRILSGEGMTYWLGDEDGKGDVIETPLDLSGKTFVQAVTAIDAVNRHTTLGSVQALSGVLPAGSVHQYQSPREVLALVCDAFGAEFRVNGDASVDAGTAAYLYNTEAPTALLVRDGAGSDMETTALPGRPEVKESVRDLTTRVKLLGQTVTSEGETELFVSAEVGGASGSYFDLLGNPVQSTRVVSESSTTTGAASARAQLALNRYSGTSVSLKLDTGDFEADGTFRVGDHVHVYDPDTGLVDTGNQIEFQNQVWHPVSIRCMGATWPVRRGMTVAFRTGTGEWIDLTPHVMWDGGGTQIVVGDLPKTLTRGGDTLQQVRVDVARATGPDNTEPAAPTGLTLFTTSGLDARGRTVSLLRGEWDPVLLNTDGTTISDLSHYVFAYRWTARAPLWQQANATDGTTAEVVVAPGLPYEARVGAVDIAGHVSWSAIVGITSALDAIAPNTPADPTVSYYLGQGRIETSGLDVLGNPMATDTKQINVHVGDTSGFTPATTNRVRANSPFARDVAFAVIPYGATKYVKLVAEDHDGNLSAASAPVAITSSQVVSADIFDGAVGTAKLADLAVTTAKINDLAVNDAKIGSLGVAKLTGGIGTFDLLLAGSIFTAASGQRSGMDALGIRAYNSASALTVDLNGASNLLTGILKTALSGRRIEIGSGGLTGALRFFSPTGEFGDITAYTASTGVEAIRIGVPISGVSSIWNSFFTSTDEFMGLAARFVSVLMGGSTTGDRGFTIDYAPFKNDLATRQAIFYAQPGGISSWVPTGGSFAVNVKNWDQPVGRMRAQIDGNGNNYFTHTQAPGVGTYFYARQADETIDLRVYFDDTQFVNRYPDINNRFYVDLPGSGRYSDTSARITIAHDGNYGTLMYHRSGALGAGHRLEFRDGGDTVYEDLWAAAFTVASSETVKDDIQPLDFDPLARLRTAEVRSYTRKAPAPAREPGELPVPKGEKRAKRTAPKAGAPGKGRREIGLIAERAPAEIVLTDGQHPMISLGDGLGLVVAAIQQLADEFDTYRRDHP